MASIFPDLKEASNYFSTLFTFFLTGTQGLIFSGKWKHGWKIFHFWPRFWLWRPNSGKLGLYFFTKGQVRPNLQNKTKINAGYHRTKNLFLKVWCRLSFSTDFQKMPRIGSFLRCDQTFFGFLAILVLDLPNLMKKSRNLCKKLYVRHTWNWVIFLQKLEAQFWSNFDKAKRAFKGQKIAYFYDFRVRRNVLHR